MTVPPPPRTIGALHAESWSGIVLSPDRGEGFAFRFAVELPDGRRADQMDLFWLVHEVGPHAPDGSYARVAFDLSLPFGLGRDTPIVEKASREPHLILEWGRVRGSAVLGRVTTRFAGTLELIPFFPWDWAGRWTRVEAPAGVQVPGAITGESGSGDWAFALETDRIPEPPLGYPDTPARKATLRFSVASGDRVDFVAALAPDLRRAHEGVQRARLGSVTSTLARARERYETGRVRVDGAWKGLAASVTNNLHWMVLLKPETGELYVPAGRRWIFPAPDGSPDHWTVFGWDSYFNALELATESPYLARTAVRAGLATQYPTGCIPNWRGRFGGTPDRSQPPVGSLAAAKLLARFGNLEPARQALPALERWAAFWRAEKEGHPRRDGNDNGLFQWGSDAENISSTPPPWEVDASGWQRAAWESGQDDLPNWDEAAWVETAETFDLDCVDLNSYLALDLECLAFLAQALGEEEKARRFLGDWEDLRARMNRVLWNEERGLYLDRKWSGEWSPRVAASNFLPLVAGVPSHEQALRMLETLTDPDWFWGDYVLPTISRNDPAFPEQQYWRGTIWPPMNYLVYQGLKRYGLDEVAGEVARRSVSLFLKSWNRYQLCRENYDSRTGEGGGQRYQSWGPLFALIGLEEFLDVTPWSGLTVGSLTPPGDTVARRIRALGHRWTVALSPDGLRLDRSGRTILASDAPVVLRHLEVEDGLLSCRTHAPREVKLRVDHVPTPRRIQLDSRPVTPDATWIPLPPGKHELRVQVADQPSSEKG